MLKWFVLRTIKKKSLLKKKTCFPFIHIYIHWAQNTQIHYFKEPQFKESAYYIVNFHKNYPRDFFKKIRVTCIVRNSSECIRSCICASIHIESERERGTHARPLEKTKHTRLRDFFLDLNLYTEPPSNILLYFLPHSEYAIFELKRLHDNVLDLQKTFLNSEKTLFIFSASSAFDFMKHNITFLWSHFLKSAFET